MDFRGLPTGSPYYYPSIPVSYQNPSNHPDNSALIYQQEFSNRETHPQIKEDIKEQNGKQ